MTLGQPMIQQPVPAVASILAFDLEAGADPREGLRAVREEPKGGKVVVGIGEPLALALGKKIEGLTSFPVVTGAGFSFPSTQHALWLWAGADERGEVLDTAMGAAKKLGSAFRLVHEVQMFRYRGGRDLTGYEDGTENPKGSAAIEASVVAGGTPGLAGGSFVAIQQYVHDLKRFLALDINARDAVIGRSFETNDELAEAPVTAHVKRSAQESFDPPAFMLRRSMPWGGLREHGLYFVSFVAELDRFERMLKRMAGLEDGQADALLGVTRALTGGYYFCPPVDAKGALDLRALGI